MSTQMEMVPETDLDRAKVVLEHLEAEVEKRERALETAGVKLLEARDLVKKQRFVIVELGGGTVEDIALKMRADAQSHGVGLSFSVNGGEEVVIAAPPIVDPVTGEVVEPEHATQCPACEGDGRIPDKTGGGHHGTCQTCGGTGDVYLGDEGEIHADDEGEAA